MYVDLYKGKKFEVSEHPLTENLGTKSSVSDDEVNALAPMAPNNNQFVDHTESFMIKVEAKSKYGKEGGDLSESGALKS